MEFTVDILEKIIVVVIREVIKDPQQITVSINGIQMVCYKHKQ